MTQADIQQMITNIFNENPYVLPIASEDNLGGIKIGGGLNISNSGKVSVNFDIINQSIADIESDIQSLQSSVNINASAISSLDGRLSQAETEISTKASASSVTSAVDRIGQLETTTTTLSSQASGFATSIADLQDCWLKQALQK